MIIASLGLPGSASTLVYNIAKSLLIAGGDAKLAYGVFDNLDSLASFDLSGANDFLLRSHSPRQDLFDMLRVSGAKCVVTTRALPDCAKSLHGRILRDEVDCLKNIVRSFAGIQTALSYLPYVELRYERHQGEPLAIVETLEAYFEIKIPAHVKKNIVHANSANEIKRLISDKTRMTPSAAGSFAFDMETQYNENHFSTSHTTTSPRFDENISRLYSRFARDDLSLRIGDDLEFVFDIFQPDSHLRVGGNGPGLMILNGIYLPRGRWALRIAGEVAGAKIKRLALCQSGVIVHQMECAPTGPLDVAFEVANINYDDDYQVFLATEDNGGVEPAPDLTFAARFTRFL